MSAECGKCGTDIVLDAATRRKAPSRSEEVSMEGLRELVDDDHLGPAARTAIACVEQKGADPRLMLLLLEQAQEGYFAPRNYFENGKGA